MSERFVCWLVGWLVGWLAGWLAGWLVGWLVGWFLGFLVSWFVGVAVCLFDTVNPLLAQHDENAGMGNNCGNRPRCLET